MGYVKETSPATLYGGATVTWYWPGFQEGDKPIFDVRATLSLPRGTGVTIFWANQPMTITSITCEVIPGPLPPPQGPLRYTITIQNLGDLAAFYILRV